MYAGIKVITNIKTQLDKTHRQRLSLIRALPRLFCRLSLARDECDPMSQVFIMCALIWANSVLAAKARGENNVSHTTSVPTLLSSHCERFFIYLREPSTRGLLFFFINVTLDSAPAKGCASVPEAYNGSLTDSQRSM